MSDALVAAKDSLVVAADFTPGKDGIVGIQGVREKVLELAKSLEGLGVYIKVNSILRACGYDLINQLHDLGLRVMADLKLVDIPATMRIDGALLAETKPEIVTVMANAGVPGMFAANEALSTACSCEVLAVTILTSFDEEGCHEVFNCPTKVGVLRLARLAQAAECDGLVLSGKEVPIIIKRQELVSGLSLKKLSLNTPGIRPAWSVVDGDDQQRVVTPADAIASGVKRVIIGRPITQTDSPREAAQKTLEEIAAVLFAKANE